MTYDDIVSVLGSVDDDLAAGLIATGASVDELREAWNWLNNDEALMAKGDRCRAHASASSSICLSQLMKAST